MVVGPSVGVIAMGHLHQAMEATEDRHHLGGNMVVVQVVIAADDRGVEVRNEEDLHHGQDINDKHSLVGGIDEIG